MNCTPCFFAGKSKIPRRNLRGMTTGLCRNQGQQQGQNHESNGDPLGGTSQHCVPGRSLVLGHKAVCNTGDGTGQTGVLTGLEHNNSNYSKSRDNLNHSDDGS